MAKKQTLNAKRLTKAQVAEIVKTEGKLHELYTRFFEEEYASGYIKKDKVYELPAGQYLYVFDEKGVLTPGKGDIYPEDYFLKWMKRVERLRGDSANKRYSSGDHWRYYSKYKQNILDHSARLLTELADKLAISPDRLDGSYKSLDLVSEACRQYTFEQLFEQLYDNLVIYVGEVIKQRVNGFWDINHTHWGGGYPFININLKHVQYMPVNAVWCAFNELQPLDFRQEAANEVRQHASRASFERTFLADK